MLHSDSVSVVPPFPLLRLFFSFLLFVSRKRYTCKRINIKIVFFSRFVCVRARVCVFVWPCIPPNRKCALHASTYYIVFILVHAPLVHMESTVSSDAGREGADQKKRRNVCIENECRNAQHGAHECMHFVCSLFDPFIRTNRFSVHVADICMLYTHAELTLFVNCCYSLRSNAFFFLLVTRNPYPCAEWSMSVWIGAHRSNVYAQCSCCDSNWTEKLSKKLNSLVEVPN